MTPARTYIVRPGLATGGADRVTVTLLRHLDRELVAPTLVLNRLEGELLAEVPDDVEVISLEASGILAARAPLRRLLIERRPDVVFSTSSGSNVTVALAAPRPGPRLVLSERNGLVRDQPVRKRWPLLLAKRLLYPRADCVTAVSSGVADDLRRRLHLADDSIRVVYNPVITPDMEAQADAAVSEAWLDSGRPLVLAAGRLVPAKGFDVLLRAMAALRAELPCRLVILGEGPERSRLAALAADLGITGAIEMPGFLPNPYALMRRCAVFALPSRFEGLPGVLIQAMACGAPVVAADCAFGPGEIVTDGEDGMLVPPDDPGALAGALKTVLSDLSKAEALGRAARSSARRFTLDAIMPRYLDALVPGNRGANR